MLRTSVVVDLTEDDDNEASKAMPSRQVTDEPPKADKAVENQRLAPRFDQYHQTTVEVAVDSLP